MYSELLQVEDKRRIEPKEHPTIPSHILGDLLEIENWLSSFSKLIEQSYPTIKVPHHFDKEYLFNSFK